jgi:hypothetical protein
LIDYPGAYATYAYGINDNGDIVGDYVALDSSGYGSGYGRAFVYRGGSYQTITPPGEALYTGAYGINNGGDVVGYYERVVPEPVPEPSTLIMLGSGILGIAGRMRRKRAA